MIRHSKFAQQVSRAIRILRGNRDESARASHLVVNKDRFVYNELLQVNQAETEKYSQSTFFERKIMSTKTAFKRVALVAAAALAIGGFSGVSANAAGPATPTFPSSASEVTGTYQTVTLTAGSNDKYYTISSTGVGTVLYPTAPNTTGLVTGTNEVWYAGATPGASSFAGGEVLTFSVYSATAGTQTLTITGNTTAANTTTITWGAAPVVSVGNSVIATNNAADIPTVAKTTVATEDTGLSAVDSVNTLAGGAYVLLNNNASPVAAVTSDVLSASVSGPGIIKIGATYAAATATAGGRSVSNAAAGSTAVVVLYGDGTAGTSTVTVSDSTAGIVLGTFTATFYSTTVAKITATTNYSVPLTIPADFKPTPTEGFTGSLGTPAVGAPVSVTAADANGNAIPNDAALISVSSSNTAVATVASSTPSWDSTNGYYYPVIQPVAEGKTTLTFTDVATGLVTATATVWVTSPVIATLTAASDNSSYDPGTKVLYTLTAADAAGNPVADGGYTDLIATAPTSNVGLQGTIPGVSSGTATTVFLGGVNSSTLYAPLATANVAIAGGVLGTSSNDLATALQGATIAEVDFSTTGSSDDAANAATDAANEATDAANAATDAANAAADSADAATQAAQDADTQAQAALAAVTALSQQVTTLLAKVASLSASVAKILKAVSKK